MSSLSLYIHVPWCIKKCPYCDFNSHTLTANLPEAAYIDALINDLNEDLRIYNISSPISSIFIGGGTPSLFSPDSLNHLLSRIKQLVTLRENIEITLEANPGTFESHKFAEFRSLGINRLSIGIQSFNDTLLKKLGRVHSAREAFVAAEIAHHAGFENFNLDLMFGLPDSNSETSKTDVTTAISLQPTHISYYQLTLEPNTKFHKFPPQLPNDELTFEIQKDCQLKLEDCGYRQYEVSAFSKAGMHCRHNVNYWQFGDYLGIGAGAHGKITQALPDKIFRTFKPKSPAHYMQNNRKSKVADVINTTDLPLEFLMNNFRLKQGFTKDTYRSTTGLAMTSLEPALSICIKEGLVTYQNNHYRCTEQGWNFMDNILEKFIS